MTKEILVGVAVLLAILGNLSYFLSIFYGKTRPHPFTWFVGSVVSLVTFFAALQKGGGIGVIPIFASEIFTILIFLISLKYGFKDIKTTDKYFLAFALLGLIPWYLTNDPTISVIVVVTIDLLSFIPTLRKAYSHPESESIYLYFSNFLRHILILLTLATINISTSLHSFVMIVLNILMVSILLFGAYRKFGKLK